MNTIQLSILSISVLCFGLISKKAERSILSAPMAFAFLGFLLGEDVLGCIDFKLVSESSFHLIAELTLVLILFTDASRINFSTLKKDHDLPIRLLGFGLPLTVILGAGLAYLFFEGMSVAEALILAAILAPTDAALGQAVVTDKRVPNRIRQTLNVESGLNDGLVLPALLIFISLLPNADGHRTLSSWILFIAKQLALAPIIGIGVGIVGGKLIQHATKLNWISEPFERLAIIALSLIAFSIAELPFLGANGFISAFVTGLTVGNCCRGICSCLFEFSEAEGLLLSLSIFFLFGGIFIPVVIEHFSLEIIIYAILSLTVVRLLPVSLSLIGKKLKIETILFLGWFGPRGLASILYVFLILETTNNELIVPLIMTTVLLSILAHGVTASPGVKVYSSKIPFGRSVSECKEVGNIPLKFKKK